MDFFRSGAVTCGPISSLEALLNWSPSSGPKFKTEKLHPKQHSVSTPKLIICHDMRNNYLDDKYYQGTNNPCDYTFYHWSLIETFIYFSHHLVTIPTESWINAAHENNVRILGTFITEWIEGDKICKEILNDSKTVDKVIDQLVSITLHYDFDGWLINIENPVQNIELLTQFVSKLRKQLKTIDTKRYQTIWYDSVIKTGELKWQNELNELNQEFFNSSDAIFINYTWKDENLVNSRANSGIRREDVYVGVDVFGRGCFGGGGFNCNLAVSKIINSGLNVALFAPGWVHECHEPEQFYKNSEKFWTLLNQFFIQEKISSLPILTTFTHSTAKNFYSNGTKVSSLGYSNFTLQTKLPVLNETAKWCFDDAFYAGNCILIEPKSEVCLFELNLALNPGKQFIIEYVTKKTDLISLQLNHNKKLLSLCDERLILDKEIVNDWCLTKVKFSPNEIMNCEMLQVINLGDLPAKLGLIKFYELKDVCKEPDTFSVHGKMNAFNLLGRSYFCVYLKWDTVKSSKYFNLFIDEKLSIEPNGVLSEVKYLGSTKKNEFRVCFSLNNETVYFEPSSYGKMDQASSFNVYIQPIDYEMHALTSRLNEFEHKCKFTPTTLRIRNKENLQFIDEIVYDLEHFELV